MNKVTYFMVFYSFCNVHISQGNTWVYRNWDFRLSRKHSKLDWHEHLKYIGIPSVSRKWKIKSAEIARHNLYFNKTDISDPSLVLHVNIYSKSKLQDMSIKS